MANTAVQQKKQRKIKGKVEIDIQKCKGCEMCTVACKEDVLKMSKDINNLGYRYAVVVNDDCTGCVNCALVCPDGVIKVYRATAKKREHVATITNVQSSMVINIETENPALKDLQNMEYL
jgi:2-oxoglutarate ferredoxin oxidoreductase subunit delta